VITGTLSNGEMSRDINIAATSSATLVILMGLSHLSEISKVICEHRSPGEPVAIIQNATFPDEKMIHATAATIESVATATGIGTPAVIVIGQVVNEARNLGKTVAKKLTAII
jgi:uroporphyrin-III C-methyltransferase